MRLDLRRWDQLGEDHPGFLVARAVAEELFDTLECIPDQLGGVLGGDGERHGRALGILRRIREAMRREKDGDDASCHMVPT